MNVTCFTLTKSMDFDSAVFLELLHTMLLHYCVILSL